MAKFKTNKKKKRKKVKQIKTNYSYMNKYLKMAIICNTKITLTDTARLNFTQIYGEKSKVFNVNGKKKVMRMQECACT